MQPYGPMPQPGFGPGHAVPPGYPQVGAPQGYPHQHGAPPGYPQAGRQPGYPPHGMPGHPQPPRSDNRLLFTLGGAALVLVIAVVAGIIVFQRASEVDPPFEAMSRAFPQLLPVEDGGTIYNGDKCVRVDPRGEKRKDFPDLDFGKWTGAWLCGGFTFRESGFVVFGYRNAKDVRSAVDGLGSKKEFTDVNSGVRYTSYELYACCYAGPKIATTFLDDPNRSSYLLYGAGTSSFEELKKWWRSAPLG
ncbi:proline-rich domain-containing protein [Nocardia lijiangensis]|uniref:proline-rich domain-containing protein n=1 Tax=Nocardia lijiangensis TaxID=299618 RepID=UPI000832A514|nr:proline-rich domain-containing protein [Nocardia lijiangensis]